MLDTNSTKPINNKNNSVENLNHDEILQMMMTSLADIELARQQSIIPLLGKTQVGKSTLINYLLGLTMQEYTNDCGITCVEPVDKKLNAPANMGDGWSSETLYPTCYKDVKSNKIYNDLPGFDESRGHEKQIWTQISTEIAIKLADNIPAIILVINTKSLEITCAKDFSELCAGMAKLLPDFEKLGKSIVFVFNRYENKTKEHIIKAIRNIIASIEGLTRNIANGIEGLPFFNKNEEKSNEKEKTLRFLKFMLANQDKIILANVYDRHSSEKIVTLVESSDALPTNLFNFNEFDNEHVKFKHVFNRAIEKASNTLHHINNTPSAIAAQREAVAGLNEKLTFCDNEIINLGKVDKGQDSAVDIAAKIKHLTEENGKNDSLLKKYTDEIKSLVEEIAHFDTELASINTDDLVVLWSDKIHEKRSFFGWLGWTQHIFELPLKNVAFDKNNIIKKQSNGGFENENSQPDQGIYSICYKSGFGHDGVAEVEIRIECKNKPENKQRIHYLETIIAEKKKAYASLETNIKKLAEENRSIDDMIKGWSGKKRTLQEINNLIRQLDRSRTDYKKQIEELMIAIKGKERNLTCATEEFHVNSDLYEALFKVSLVLNFSSPLINDFRYQYRYWLNLQHSSKSFLLYDDPKEYQCPISHALMEKAVLTACHHTFDRASIGQLIFDNGDNCKCPQCQSPILLSELRTNLNLDLAIDKWRTVNHVKPVPAHMPKDEIKAVKENLTLQTPFQDRTTSTAPVDSNVVSKPAVTIPAIAMPKEAALPITTVTELKPEPIIKLTNNNVADEPVTPMVDLTGHISAPHVISASAINPSVVESSDPKHLGAVVQQAAETTPIAGPSPSLTPTITSEPAPTSDLQPLEPQQSAIRDVIPLSPQHKEPQPIGDGNHLIATACSQSELALSAVAAVADSIPHGMNKSSIFPRPKSPNRDVTSTNIIAESPVPTIEIMPAQTAKRELVDTTNGQENSNLDPNTLEKNYQRLRELVMVSSDMKTIIEKDIFDLIRILGKVVKESEQPFISKMVESKSYLCEKFVKLIKTLQNDECEQLEAQFINKQTLLHQVINTHQHPIYERSKSMLFWRELRNTTSMDSILDEFVKRRTEIASAKTGSIEHLSKASCP